MPTSATVFQDLVNAQKRLKLADTAVGVAQQTLVAARAELEAAEQNVKKAGERLVEMAQTMAVAIR